MDVKSLDVATGVKMSLGTNVTMDQKYSGRSVVVQMSVVQMSVGRSVGERSVKVPIAMTRQSPQYCSLLSVDKQTRRREVVIEADLCSGLKVIDEVEDCLATKAKYKFLVNNINLLEKNT